MKRSKNNTLYLIIAIIIVICSYFNFSNAKIDNISIEEVYNFNNVDFIYINENKASFDEKLLVIDEYEKYSNLDRLGRCGTAIANLSINLMPTEKRGSIGMIKPTGWHTVKYDNIKDKYLYNRCHLIGYQLSGENANEKNLITCTRQMNIGKMLDLENEVADYIKKTKNHVLYMVTPVFNEDDLLAYGVHMMAYSIEDNGKGINFNVFVYNRQDGIDIDYSDGSSKLAR